MRILYIFPEEFPNDKARGVQVAHSVCALASQGATLYFAYVPSNNSPNPFSFYGIKIPETVNLIPLSRTVFNIRSNKIFYWNLKKWLKSLKKLPDCIIVRHIKIAYYLLINFPQIPVIYEAHEVFADVAPENIQAKIHKMENLILSKASIVIAISNGTAERLKKRYLINREIFVLPDGVNISNIPFNKTWNEIHQNIIYTGSLLEWKGVEDLVKAGQFLPGFKITIIGGNTSQIEKLQKKVNLNGAEITFLGYVPHQEIATFLKNACIAVLPNRNEPISMFTSPLKLFEYMASGCAIVASNIPSIREILNDDEAIWFEPGNPYSLAEAIKLLASNPEKAKRMGEILKQKANNYTWESRAKRIIGVINEKIPQH
jgi:glycosyltransferase involved in cell wall biosynthesis